MKEEPQTARSRKKQCSGVSIIETVVALFIFAIFIAGASKLLLSGIQLSGSAQAHYIAANLAKNKLELIQSFDFSERSDFSGTETLVNTHGTSDPLGNYRISTTFNNVAGNSNTVEVIILVDIRNRKTLEFEGANEEVRSYQTIHLTKDD